MDKVIRKNLKKIDRKEDKFLQKTGGGLLKPLTDKVEEKIPAGLYEKLQQAFYLGFKVVFEKGDAIIEKTYDREQLQLTHRVYDESFEQLNKKKGLKALNKLAGKGNRVIWVLRRWKEPTGTFGHRIAGYSGVYWCSIEKCL